MLRDLQGNQGAVKTVFAKHFVSGLIDPAQATPDGIVGPGGKSAVKRYNVYRNNVTVSLIDALASIYPAVQRITGVEFFRAMARFHVRETPPASPLLFEYGRDFPAFIETYDYAQELPWLADVARIERAWLDAYHAADVDALAGGILASVPPEQLGELVFVAHPATAIVRSAYPAVAIFGANRSAAPVGPLQSLEAEDALVTRPEGDVVVRNLPPGAADFLNRLIAGEPLAAAAATAIELCPSFDLAGGISGMIEAGAFAAIKFGEAR
jgi:hypothetical protein